MESDTIQIKLIIMKATHKKGDGLLISYLRIKQEITATMLEQTTTVMLEEEDIVNIKAVREYIENRLTHTGRSFFDYGFWDDDRGISNEAKELSRKLFPTFY